MRPARAVCTDSCYMEEIIGSETCRLEAASDAGCERALITKSKRLVSFWDTSLGPGSMMAG
jgi:hypothetical protein